MWSTVRDINKCNQSSVSIFLIYLSNTSIINYPYFALAVLECICVSEQQLELHFSLISRENEMSQAALCAAPTSSVLGGTEPVQITTPRRKSEWSYWLLCAHKRASPRQLGNICVNTDTYIHTHIDTHKLSNRTINRKNSLCKHIGSLLGNFYENLLESKFVLGRTL